MFLMASVFTSATRVRTRIWRGGVKKAAEAAGADGVTLINTLFGLGIDKMTLVKMAQKAKWKVVSVSYESPGGEAKRAIDGDPQEPAVKRAFAAPGADHLVGGHETLLRDIFGRVVITKDARACPEDGS